MTTMLTLDNKVVRAKPYVLLEERPGLDVEPSNLAILKVIPYPKVIKIGIIYRFILPKFSMYVERDRQQINARIYLADVSYKTLKSVQQEGFSILNHFSKKYNKPSGILTVEALMVTDCDNQLVTGIETW